MIVRTNDEKTPEFTLVISGDVKPVADIAPATARLTGSVGQEIKQTITIASTGDNRFKIMEVETEEGDNIRFDLVEMKQSNGVKYQLTVYNEKQEKGWYIDKIHLTTDSDASPVITIPVLGFIRDEM
jgi:hypothetical protein